LNKEPIEITEDHFYKGKVILSQSKKGYRFSVDSPILADFLPETNEKTLEIGTGIGVITILALFKKKIPFAYGIEIQENLYRLTKMNVEKNGFSEIFQIKHGDFREEYNCYKGINYIFSNPPYQELGVGRLSPRKEILTAKTEYSLRLKDLLIKTYRILGEGGSLFLIYPYYRYEELLKQARKTGYFAAKTREVYSYKDGKPERFLIQLTNCNVPEKELTPLIIFKQKGKYTEEMDKILTGK
jgi:tRNA1Val (adenine37-N6)-methyltransferase